MKALIKKQILIALLGIFLLLSRRVTPDAFASDPSDDLEVIRQAAANYFPYQPRQYHISADNLYNLLYDSNSTNDPVVVSVQTSAEYTLGHIPGAINIPWDEITDIAQIQDRISKDRLTVIYCNHAIHSPQISVILNLLGYNTLDLAYGFEGWTQNRTAIPNHFNPEGVCEHIIEKEVHFAEPTYHYPKLIVTGSTLEEVITAAANAYLASERDTCSTIYPKDLEQLLTDEELANDPFVLSLQWTEDYIKGHVPNAINIPPWALFQPENLSRLPADRPIVLYCYLGFTSSQVAAILNMMGYHVQVLSYGITAWTLDPKIAHFYILDSRTWRDYPIEGAVMDQMTVSIAPVEDNLLPLPAHLPETGGVVWPALVGLGFTLATIGWIIRIRL
jgi:rhodanese-related sulfurtransferase